jgi:hypothetical protein
MAHLSFGLSSCVWCSEARRRQVSVCLRASGMVHLEALVEVRCRRRGGLAASARGPVLPPPSPPRPSPSPAPSVSVRRAPPRRGRPSRGSLARAAMLALSVGSAAPQPLARRRRAAMKRLVSSESPVRAAMRAPWAFVSRNCRPSSAAPRVSDGRRRCPAL